MQAAMREEFAQLADQLLSQCGDQPVYYFPNGGNWGDALIRHGTQKFLADIGLCVTTLHHYKVRIPWRLPLLRKGTLLFGGGGAWCNLWNKQHAKVSRLSRYLPAVVLPSTYENSYQIDNCQFYCRDRYQSQIHMPTARFCSDMAFYIGDEFRSSNRGRGVGYFFRTDRESALSIDLPQGNIDISAGGNHLSDVSGFFGAINRFHEIHTDRLHVAIASCLLDKQVHLYPGAYFKNQATFNSSILGRFEQAYFHPTHEALLERL